MLKNAGFKIESRNLDSQSGDIIESYWSEARSMRIIFLGKRVELEKYNFDKNLTRCAIDLPTYRAIEQKLKEKKWI